MSDTLPPTLPQFALHDRVIMRKPHPCGSLEWEVYRLGGDIGLRCLTCGRRVLLARSVLIKQMKHVIHPPDTAGVEGGELT
jgi:hypothetical protein